MKIIIIGNGYDLNIGLKSTFGDFYKSYYRSDNNDWNYEKIRSNVWRLLLYFKYIDGNINGIVDYDNTSPRWMDVESFICDVLNSTVLMNSIGKSYAIIEKKQPTDKISSHTYDAQLHELQSLVQMKARDFGYFDSMSLLMDDLHEIERDFIDYMDKIIRFDYSIKSSNLMSKLTINFDKTFVVSFNYTKLPASLYYVNQVHGSLAEDNVIIGIDKRKINNKDIQKMRFTKSWRKLQKSEMYTKLPAKEDVDEIVVFGHSLGEQDYSYFHSLFNFYDIYSSGIRLSFIYANHHYQDEQKMFLDVDKCEKYKQEYTDSVYCLLSDYVERVLGREEADSFITKLQLEGRLIVEELGTYYGFIKHN